MVLKKGFLHPNPEFIKISRQRLIIGIVLGVLYSFIFYSLLFVIREAIRLLSILPNYDLWILSENEIAIYNLFFAFISTIMGQSIAILYVLDRPKRLYDKTNYRKTTIINDQRVLNWSFLQWFAKIAFGIGLLFSSAMPYGERYLGLYPAYSFIFILVVIVLFMQTWTTIRLIFKRKSLKWGIISVVIISGLAFSMSRIDVVDYKALNQHILSKNTYKRYDLELPKAVHYQRITRASLLEDLYMVFKQDDSLKANPIVIVGDEEIPFTGIKDFVNDERDSKDPADFRFLIWRLNIHGEVKMVDVNRLKNELFEAGVQRVYYAVEPMKDKDEFYRGDLPYSFRTILGNTSAENKNEIYKNIHQDYNIIEVRLDISGNYIIDNIEVNINFLKQVFKDILEKHPKSCVVYYYDNDVRFADYFEVISRYKEVVYELRDLYSISRTSKTLEYVIDETIRKEIFMSYPYKIYELSE
jgi:hypothetical protein